MFHLSRIMWVILYSIPMCLFQMIPIQIPSRAMH